MAKRTDIKKILIIGSGPIVIGQAAEFDYAGTQACLALKEEGYEVVLCNSNPATIMTDINIADRVYVEPVNVEFLENIIKRERPDSLLATLGGQVGLNLAMALEEKGILADYNVKLLGTQISAIKRGEDRELFKEAMEKIYDMAIISDRLSYHCQHLEWLKKEEKKIYIITPEQFSYSAEKELLNSLKDVIKIEDDQKIMEIFKVDIEAVTKDMRRMAKAVNFGILYGMGEFSLAEDLKISRAQAKGDIESYLSSYPAIDAYLHNVATDARADGYVTTMLGRRRYIPELAASNKNLQAFGERVARNSPIQGSSADIIKIAMINVAKKLSESGIDAKLLLQVHDELLIESSRECAEEALAILKTEMENAVSLTVPLKVEAAIGETWLECH